MPIANTVSERKVNAPYPYCADVLPRHLILANKYLGTRGTQVDDFEAARGEVIQNASRLDAVFPRTPALVFNFVHPLTGEPLTFTDPQGQVRTFQRIRPLGARGAKFLQPRGSGTHIYFAPHPNVDWRDVLADPSYGLVISEGETRSLAGAVNDLAVISVTGVDCGQVDGKLHPDLDCVEWRGRQVFLAFDSDLSWKRGPQIALQKLAALLRERGAEVFETAIPPTPTGSKQGLDDYLACHGGEAFACLLQSPETRPAPGVESYDPPLGLTNLMATNYPPTEWAWDGFILRREVNLLFGDGGVGKSLLALYAGIAVAAGRRLFGTDTMQMPFIGLFAEDSAAQVQQRIITILIELGLDAKGNLPVRLWCQPHGDTMLARIDDSGVVTELPRLHALRAELAALDGPALIVLDSLADLFALNESLRLPVNAALKQVLGSLCREYGATVLVLAHPSKASMADGSHYSGSTAFNNAVRQRLTLEIEKQRDGEYIEGPPPRKLSVAKTNYGATGEKRLWYYGPTITELSQAPSDDGRAAAFHKAVVHSAITAANMNLPCNRRHINEQVFEAGKKILGRRPSNKEVLRELEKGSEAKELYFEPGTSKRAAGFYPPDPEAAVALALATRKADKAKRRAGNA